MMIKHTPIFLTAFTTLTANLVADPIAVPNASFEDPDRTGLSPAYSSGSPTGWTFTSGVNWGAEEIRDTRFGIGGPEGSRLDALGGDADQVGYINIGNAGTGSATSDVLDSVVAGATYTLTVTFAQRASGDQLPDGEIGLWVDGGAVGSFTAYTNVSMPPGSFTEVVYTWTAPSVGDPLVGGNLQIRMDFTYSGSGVWEQAQFDRIRLEISQDGPFAITAIAITEGGPMITFDSTPGSIYTIKRSTDLEVRRELTDNYPQDGAIGTSTSYTDTEFAEHFPDGAPRVFYRVERGE